MSLKKKKNFAIHSQKFKKLKTKKTAKKKQNQNRAMQSNDSTSILEEQMPHTSIVGMLKSDMLSIAMNEIMTNENRKGQSMIALISDIHCDNIIQRMLGHIKVTNLIQNISHNHNHNNNDNDMVTFYNMPFIADYKGFEPKYIKLAENDNDHVDD